MIRRHPANLSQKDGQVMGHILYTIDSPVCV